MQICMRLVACNQTCNVTAWKLPVDSLKTNGASVVERGTRTIEVLGPQYQNEFGATPNCESHVIYCLPEGGSVSTLNRLYHHRSRRLLCLSLSSSLSGRFS